MSNNNTFNASQNISNNLNNNSHDLNHGSGAKFFKEIAYKEIKMNELKEIGRYLL
jgi:hypothetical protein